MKKVIAFASVVVISAAFVFAQDQQQDRRQDRMPGMETQLPDFSELDQNGDGIIDQAEFMELFEYLADEERGGITEEKYDKLLQKDMMMDRMQERQHRY